MEEILFTKMHGLGNDYIYINCLASTPRQIQQLAIEMSRPHTGVGSDGIIIICPSDVADFRMRIFNADGSEARMCGNGARCVGKYIHDYGLSDSLSLTLETLGGIKRIDLVAGPDGLIESATVNMGLPDFRCSAIPAVCPYPEMIDRPIAIDGGHTYNITAVSMGNPHGVIVTPLPLGSLPLADIGPRLEHHPTWPERANIEFINIISRHELAMRVWERGSGETQACGTGACASAAVACRLGLAEMPVTVHLPGGDLLIDTTPDGEILMTGPAVTSFEGRYFRQSSSSL